jgi:hypothetical protein
MRASRILLLSSFLVFMFVSLSDVPLQMIKRANAACLPWPRCCWQGIVFGTATVTNPKAHITTIDLEKSNLSADVDVSPDMLKAFKEEGLLGKPVHGFIILTEMKMTGFVPTTLEHKDEDKKIPPQQALKVYNEAFEKEVIQQKDMQSGGKKR